MSPARVLMRLACLALPAAAACSGAPPADGTLVAMDADDVAALARSEHKPVLASLWGTWCAPCIADMPVLTAFQAAHPEVVVLGLATDDATSASGAARLRKVLSEARPGYRQARLAPGGEADFLAAFGQRWDGMLPKLVVLARDGTPSVTIEGALDGETLARRLAPALGVP